MRRFIHLLLAVASVGVISATAYAQPRSAFADREATSSLTVGLGYAGGASMSLDVPENWKVNPVFAWRAGVDATYPLTSVISAALSFGIDHRGTKVFWFKENVMWEQRQVDYFYIAPGFQFSAFYLGINFGFPMGGARSWQDLSDSPENSTELDNTRNELSTMIEPRIGAVVPLYDAEIGWLGLTIGAGYNLSNMSESTTFLPGAFEGQNVGTQTVSIHLGITWQFAIPGTSRRAADQ